MRKFPLLLVLFYTLSTVSAQDRKSLLQRINEIKSQSDIYYWDRFTHENADTAKVNATKRLLLDVNNTRDENAFSVEEIMPHATYIHIDRGNLTQYFVYISKSYVASMNKGGAQPSTSIVSAPIVSSPATSSPVVSTSAVSAPAVALQKAFVPDAFVQRVMGTGKFMDVIKLLKSMQAQGQILQFGKLRDVEDYSSLDLILFDMQSQDIVTMLSPIGTSGSRTNVVNGAEDSLDNYPTNMTAVIWYIKK